MIVSIPIKTTVMIMMIVITAAVMEFPVFDVEKSFAVIVLVLVMVIIVGGGSSGSNSNISNRSSSSSRK